MSHDHRPLASDAASLMRSLGVTQTFAELLISRGIVEPARARTFLDPRLADLTSPDAMCDRTRASERIADAITKRERVVIFGDYDVDGITSAAIMTLLVRTLGGEAVPVLASRFDGGYGFSARALERVLEQRPGLVVTCDCGSSDHERLDALRAAGIDAVVIDHHLVPERALPAFAFLNPHRPECAFPFKHLASCGLALSIGAAIRARLGAALDLRSFLDLVALGTIADVAPLVGDNRALVRAGLHRLSTSPRPGLRALLDVAGVRAGTTLGAEDVSFRLAPRINAPGRLGSPDRALALLLEDDPARARSLAAQLEADCVERREIERKIVSDALDQVEQTGQRGSGAIVVAGQGWHVGVVGIVAARLVDRFAVPTIVVALEGDTGRGSVRGPNGSRLHDALTASQEALVSFGGHQAAAGVHVRSDRIDALRARFVAACAEQARADAIARAGEPEAKGHDVALRHDEDVPALVRDLDRFEPSGEGNRAPRFLLVGAEVVSARILKQEHLRLVLRHGARTLDAFGFGFAASAPKVGDRVDLVGSPRRDGYRGGDAVEIRIGSFARSSE